jgi:hypothetical protein
MIVTENGSENREQHASQLAPPDRRNSGRDRSIVGNIVNF